jgi:DNA-binding NarL/FixJ family response regulator
MGACDDRDVPERVLIVDDHAPFRSLARALLSMEGFEIVGEAASGGSALDAVRELRPSVVLLDIHLPDFDGFEVARRLYAGTDPPMIVFVSSRAVTSFRRRLAQSPARGFIPKHELSGDALARLVG